MALGVLLVITTIAYLMENVQSSRKAGGAAG
jgi:hypothetical protein